MKVVVPAGSLWSLTRGERGTTQVTVWSDADFRAASFVDADGVIVLVLHAYVIDEIPPRGESYVDVLVAGKVGRIVWKWFMPDVGRRVDE